MKTKLTLTTLMAALAIGLTGAAPAALGDVPTKGAPALLKLKQLRSEADVKALKNKDTIAMSCSKCKSVTVMRYGWIKKNRRGLVPGTRHECPGCSSYIEIKGLGKAKERVIHHVCQACGDESAYCCATSADAKPTKGMAKDGTKADPAKKQ